MIAAAAVFAVVEMLLLGLDRGVCVFEDAG